MSRRRRRTASEGAIASIVGGAVTSEHLVQAARREGRDGSPLIRSLLAQSMPSAGDLARVYASSGGVPRLDSSFLDAAPQTARLVDVRLLSRHGCLPVAIMDDLCVLAVEEGRAEEAVRAVRTALQRDVLPVIADGQALRTALNQLGAAPRGIPLGIVRRKDSPAKRRFNSLVVGCEALDGIPLPPTTNHQPPTTNHQPPTTNDH